MNRLRDDADDDPTSKREIEWLRDTPPTPAMPDMKRRVWAALQQRSRARSSDALSSGVRMGGLKVFAMGATVIALAGTAGAMITGRWVAPVLERSSPPSKSGVAGQRADRSKMPRRLAGARVREAAAPFAVGEPTAAPPPDPALAPAPAPAITPAEPKARRSSSVALAARGAVRSAPDDARPMTSTARARTEVLDALVALRRDRDPVRAGALLDRYLAAHARGVLREEALVLAIEAADARGDSLAGQRFARVYEFQYPRGRFRQFVRGHIESSGARSEAPSFGFDSPAAPAPSSRER